MYGGVVGKVSDKIAPDAIVAAAADAEMSNMSLSGFVETGFEPFVKVDAGVDWAEPRAPEKMGNSDKPVPAGLSSLRGGRFPSGL